MKKHFLLLLWMTLLPLAGWAANIDVEVRPFDASVDWTGAKPAQVQSSWITCTPAVGDAVKTDIANALTIQDLDSYNAGIYTYKLKKLQNSVTSGGDTYNLMVSSSYSAELTINKIQTAPTVDATGLAYVAGDLKYDGSAHALLATGATAQTNAVEVPVVYATSATAETWYSLTDLKETNAGTYTVYYKVAETINYAGSEPEPMATTKSIDKATITFNLSAAAGLTYNGAPQALLALTDNTKPATNFGASTLQYKIDDAEEWAELPEAGIAGITGTSAKNGVAYSINLKVPADGNGNWDETVITAPIATTIAKATPIFTYVPTLENGGLPSGLVYDPQQTHQLVLQEATAIVENTEIQVPVKYAMRRYKNVSKGYTSWTDKTYDELVGNYASSQYQIRVKTDETDDLNQAIQLLEKVKIDKATIPADAYTEPVAKNVRTTGALQPLVDAATWTGETTYGTFQYSLTNNGTDWSTDVPQGKDVAEYTVYWRIYPTVSNGTQNYNIVSGNYYTSNITDKSKVTIAAKANQTFGYGTTPVIDYTTVWTEQGSDELNVTGMEWNWYTNSDCSTPATVDGNNNFTVGDYFVKASGATVTGTTAASQEIVYTPVAVKITAGQVTAKISGTATYGSQPEFTLTHVSGLSPAEAENFNAGTNLTNVTIKQNGEVVNNLENVAPDNAGLAALAKGEYDLEATASCGTNYAVVVTGEKLTVGAKSIAGAVIDVTTDADAIVYNNKAWGTVNPIDFTVTETSGIEAADYDVTYSNNVNAGTATITLTGKRNYTGNVTKNFTIKKAGLTIKAVDFTGDKAWTYGTTEPTYAVTVEGQAEGETPLEVGGTLAGIDGALTVVRTSNETVGMHTGALVAQFGTAQPVESDNYTITYPAGDLQVAKGAVVIKLKEAVTATYGDDPATSINAAIKNIANYEYVSGLSELEAANFASFIDVAAATFVLTETKPQVGNDYTFEIAGATSTNYGVTINPGTFKVTAAPITLYAKDQAIDWSDTDPDNDAADTEVSGTTVAIVAGAGDLKYTDELKDVVASIVIESQNVGTNNISLTAAENANYNIIVNSDGTNTKYGVLTVTGAPTLALSTADTDLADKLASYNGKSMPVTIDFTNRNNEINYISNPKTGEKYGTSWKAEEWNTLVLPFDISVADLSQVLGYAIVNVIDPDGVKLENDKPVFKFKLTMTGGNGGDGVLKANRPFTVKTAANVTGVKNFGSQKIVAPTAEDVVDAGRGCKFVGTYTTKTINSESEGKLRFLPGDYTNWLSVGSSSSNKYDVVPFAAYIDMTNLTPEQAAHAMFIFEELDGSTTAIKSIEADEIGGKKSAEGWYTINGVKLQNAPVEKGVYIKDGKKVVIK